MYQTCPFCDRVFEIGDSDYRPMKHHIRARHADTDDGRTADQPSRVSSDRSLSFRPNR